MLQTLEGFLSKPFGNTEPKSNEFEQKYKALVSRKRIYMEACTKVDETFLVHIKVGSDSNDNQFYDVILLFFTDDDVIKRDITFHRYYVKFFSNSPSFIYQYAVLYKQEGVLIDALAEKMDAMYADKLPEKANPNLKTSYDKSIYAACRFMQDHKVSAFSKAGFMARRKKPADKFFSDVKSFEDVKFTSELNKIAKTVEKEAAIAKDKEDVHKKRRIRIVGRGSTSKPGVTPVKMVKKTTAKTNAASRVKHVKRVSRKKKK